MGGTTHAHIQLQLNRVRWHILVDMSVYTVDAVPHSSTRMASISNMLHVPNENLHFTFPLLRTQCLKHFIFIYQEHIRTNMGGVGA